LFRKLTLGAVAPPLLALAQGFVNFVSLRAVVLRVIVTQKWVLRGRNGRIFTPLRAPGVAALHSAVAGDAGGAQGCGID